MYCLYLLRNHVFAARWFAITYQLESILSERGPFSSPNSELLLIFKYDHTVEKNPEDKRGLPNSSWIWVDEWFIQTVVQKRNSSEYMKSETSEGWFYALDWPYEMSPKKNFTSNVRRRRWERTRRQKTAEEFIDRLLDVGYSRHTLMQVCNNGNISPDGIFDFENVGIVCIFI